MSAFILSSLFGCSTPKFDTLSTADFQKVIGDKSVQVVDVRTPSEFADGHIAGSVNMDVSGNFERQIATLDKSKPVAVYCRSGVRSRQAATILTDNGFKVYNLKGGIVGWVNDSLPTTK